MARRRGRSRSRRFSRGDKHYVWTATTFENQQFPFTSDPAGPGFIPDGLILVSDAMWERTAGFEKCILERLIVLYHLQATFTAGQSYPPASIPRVDWAIIKTDEDAAIPDDPHDPDFLVEEDILQIGTWRPTGQWGAVASPVMSTPPAGFGYHEIDINVKRKLDSSEVIALVQQPKDYDSFVVAGNNGIIRFNAVCRALVRLM